MINYNSFTKADLVKIIRGSLVKNIGLSCLLAENIADDLTNNIPVIEAICSYFKKEKEINNMKIKLDEGAFMPTRAHDTDAGLDLYSRETVVVSAKESVTFDTGVHIELPPDTVGFLKSKSGLNVKHGITSEGVIDEGYTGSIAVKLYNHSGYDYKVNQGDKISQLVILPIIKPDLEVVDSLDETDRGDNGFGSSGR